MPDIKSIVLGTPAEALEDVLSPFIEEQFPSFMRSDYRKLILFIKAYYEWAETQNNPSFVNQKVGSIRDVDNSLEQFYTHFKNMYLDGFPEQLAINIDGNQPNKRTLIKKIKNFYGNKGTESAYRFLFRVLFDSDVEFYIPKNFILRASDGQWVEEISVKITRNNEDKHQYLLGGTVEQYNGLTLLGAANIDRVFKYYQDGVPVTELFLTNLVGNFIPNAILILNPQEDSGQDSFTETAFSVLGEFFVQTPGENYRVGDTVYVTTGGVGFSAKVEQTGLAGAVKRIRIENSGVNYFSSVTAVVVSPNGSNNTAKILLTPSAITRYPGYYKGNRGKVSSTQKLYDGDLYQEFSYQLKSAVSIDKYYSVLRHLIHPAGMKMFGSILLENTVESPSSGSSQLTRVGIPVLGNYTPYTLGTTFDLRANGVTAAGSWVFQEYGITYGTTGDLYPLGYNPYIESAGFTGPNGRTAPIGTLFRQGGSGGGNTGLGYTYCYVPESGKTAHRPLGAPLGGFTAWSLWYESKLTPDMVGYSPVGIVGLTLWLKPENIGVCGGTMITGRSMDIWRDASGSGNHALPPKWDMWNATYAGITVDKLRPTLIVRDRGVTGCTGIQFNGGVIYGPHTVWLQAGTCGGYATGKTLGAISSVIPFAPGNTGEKILSGQFFSLTNGLTLTKDMTAFIVFRAGVTATGSTAAGYTGSNYGLGLVSSAKKFLDFSPATGTGFTFTGTETDHAFYHRSYYDVDIDATKQTTSYYFANATSTESLYPYDTGLVGFRSNVGSTGALRMAYDPYTSTLTGITAENISIGEWRRETDSRIRTFYSGDESKNLSIITARRIARATSPGGSSINNIAASESAYNSETISLGRFGAYCLPVLDCPYGVTHANFVNYALANPSYSFKGVIYEVVVYDRVLTESERQTVYGYLSRKYNLDPVMPLSYATSHPSATLLGYSYWDISKHPSTAGSAKILAGTSFGNITIKDFLSLYGVIYRSAGTRLSDGTVLTQDTYTVLGE